MSNETRDSLPPNDVPSAHACDTPERDVNVWNWAALTINAAFRLPPWLEPVPDSPRDVGGKQPPYLLLLCGSPIPQGRAHDPAVWLAAWLKTTTGYASVAYPPERRARVAERSTCVARLQGVDVNIATWRTFTIDAPPSYDVAAFWAVGDGRWIHLLAHAPTREKQDDVLAALRSLHSSGGLDAKS